MWYIFFSFVYKVRANRKFLLIPFLSWIPSFRPTFLVKPDVGAGLKPLWGEEAWPDGGFPDEPTEWWGGELVSKWLLGACGLCCANRWAAWSSPALPTRSLVRESGLKRPEMSMFPLGLFSLWDICSYWDLMVDGTTWNRMMGVRIAWRNMFWALRTKKKQNTIN